MRSRNDVANDLERLEFRLFPADPPPSAEIDVDVRRLPYEPTVAGLSPALSRVIERFGLHDRPLLTACEADGEEEFQVLAGSRWIKAAREAGLDRVKVRALELPDISAAFLSLVMNQAWAADVATQADALQVLLEHEIDEEEVARTSGLGRGRIRRLATLLELQPALRQALRAGELKPQLAFAAAALSPQSQEQLAAIYENEGELTSADLRSLGEGEGAAQASDGASPNGGADPVEDESVDVVEALAALKTLARQSEDPAARARRQAEELLRTLEQGSLPGELRRLVAEVVEGLGRIGGSEPAGI